MTRTCTDCGIALSERNSSGRCIPHYRQWMKDAGPTEGTNDAHRFNAVQSNAAFVLALKRYAIRHHPDAEWLKNIPYLPSLRRADTESIES